MVLIAGPWVSSAIGNQFNTVAGAIGSGTTGENFHEPQDILDPANGTAFAVYSEDDHSLMFYKRRGVPKVGEMFNYRHVTAVYTGFETEIYGCKGSDNYIPWESIHEKVLSVKVVDDGLIPRSVGHWFDYFYHLNSCDLARLNFENAASMNGLFFHCASLSCLTLPQTNFSSITDMYATFERCSSLRFDCSNWNVSGCIKHLNFNAGAPGVILPKAWQ